MNLPGNVLQTALDLLNTFSHQELKTIEAALSLSKQQPPPPLPLNTTNDPSVPVQKYNYFCPTPPTWSSETNSTTTTTASLADFEDLDINAIMNNLPKLPATSGAAGQPNATSSAGSAGGPAAHPNQFQEYLEMQQRAQNLHQQQTQAQNQALAAAAAAAAAAATGSSLPGHYLGQRPFVGAPSVAGGPIPPPLAVMSQQAPPPLQQGVQQPANQQRQPLALTNNAPRPVEQQSSATVPSVASNTVAHSQISAAPTAPTGSVQTTTVKLSYQQKEVVTTVPTNNTPQSGTAPTAAPSSTTTNAAGLPVLPPLHPIQQQSQPAPLQSKPTTAQVVPPSATGSPPTPVNKASSSPVAAVASPTKQQPQDIKVSGTSPTTTTVRNNPPAKVESSPTTVVATDKKPTEAVVPPLKLVLSSPKSPIKPTTPVATVTTPSKTSMKLATVTTPRIKQTARKSQSALPRSPTNLASISPPKAPPQPQATPTKSSPPQTQPPAATPVAPEQSPQKSTTTSPMAADKVSPKPQPQNTTTPVQKKREPKAKATPSAESAAVAGVDSGKAKRNRIRTVPYQIPTPEITLAQKLSIAATAESPGSSKRANSRNGSGSSDSGAEDKLTLFYKNEFVAVRNAEDGFFLCQVLQNVYKGSPKIKIRWLSETTKASVYVPDFYDVTDLECILTNVELDKGKGEYVLPKEEQTRIENILKKAMGLLEVQDITEDNPDGLDLSIYKDEAQLDRKEDKKPAKKAVDKTPKTPKPVKKVEKNTPRPSPAATKRTSNGVAKTPKGRGKAVASPAQDETPTRASKRARAIASPNYREDDEDDLPILKAVQAASSVEAKPKTPAKAPAKPPAETPKTSEEKVESPVAVAKAKTPGKGKAKGAAAVVPVSSPVVTTPPAKAVAKPKVPAAVKEMKKKVKEAVATAPPPTVDAPTATAKAGKKTPGKRKADPEPSAESQKPASPTPAKKAKTAATPTGAKKAATVSASKEAESTKKAATTVSPKKGAASSPVSATAKKASPAGKGRGRGKK